MVGSNPGANSQQVGKPSRAFYRKLERLFAHLVFSQQHFYQDRFWDRSNSSLPLPGSVSVLMLPNAHSQPRGRADDDTILPTEQEVFSYDLRVNTVLGNRSARGGKLRIQPVSEEVKSEKANEINFPLRRLLGFFDVRSLRQKRFINGWCLTRKRR